jgi:predicted small lipoprotein YifL
MLLLPQRLILLAIMVPVCLLGCGQKGPLRMPEVHDVPKIEQTCPNQTCPQPAPSNH